MKRLYPLILLLLVCPTFGRSGAADPVKGVCTLTLKNSPTVHGLQLRMAEADFKKIVGSRDAPMLNSSELATLNGFEDIENLSYGFYKAKLSDFLISYHVSRPLSGKDFAQSVSERLKLPTDAWVFADDSDATMQCNGFKVRISTLAYRVRLIDTVAFAAMAKENGTEENK